MNLKTRKSLKLIILFLGTVVITVIFKLYLSPLTIFPSIVFGLYISKTLLTEEVIEKIIRFILNK